MLLALLFATQVAQVAALPMDKGWELAGEGSRIERHRGVETLRLDNGRAIRRDVALQDGTIEFDMELIPYRTFVYLQFRMESDTEFEEIYFRSHKSGLPDAVQYNPVWNGDSFWQLYHGPSDGANPRFRYGTWTHVRLVLQGQRGALFLDGATSPTLLMDLARPSRTGYIALRGFDVDPIDSGKVAATFANVVVRPGVVPWQFPARAAVAAPEPGSITRWQISPAFEAGAEPVTTLPTALLATREAWPSYLAEPNGIVLIGRHMRRPRPVGGAIARLVIRSSGSRVQRLHLGYSDLVTVFANGAPVFAGDAHYSFDQPRQEGLIGRWQSTLWLPLHDGDNEILISVVDGFGGWALTGRLEPGDGGVLIPPP